MNELDTEKAPLASPTFTGTVTIPTPFTLGAVSVLPTGTELNFVDGVTSNIQTQLDAKQAALSGTGIVKSTAGTISYLTDPLPITNGGTGSATKNFVDLTTNQTIAGVKTFSSDVFINTIKVGLGAGSIETNTAVGSGALSANIIGGSGNTANGYAALYSNTTGSNNTANGAAALYFNTTGINNTANGNNALSANTIGNYNTANGTYALYNNTVGYFNTAIGSNTGGGITTGSNNTILGANVNGLASGLTKNIILANGTGAIKARHDDDTGWTMTGTVTADGFILSSDLRYKDIISRTASADGVDMIVYTWKKELNRDHLIHYGYVAQEVEKVYPNQVQTNEEGYKSVNYIEVLVAKNQELEKKNQELEKRMEALELLMKK